MLCLGLLLHNKIMRLQLCSAWRNEIWVEGRLEFDRQRLPRQRQTVQTARFNDSLFDDRMAHHLMMMVNDSKIAKSKTDCPSCHAKKYFVRLLMMLMMVMLMFMMVIIIEEWEGRLSKLTGWRIHQR